MKQIGRTVLVARFTAETCRTYQYEPFSNSKLVASTGFAPVFPVRHALSKEFQTVARC